MMLVGAVALIFVGPEKLPQMLHTLGRWANKLRRLTNEVRHQSGIDDILRQGGIKGGLDEIRELRNLVRGNVAGLAAGALNPAAAPSMVSALPAASPSVPPPPASHDITKAITADRSREYPLEGCDAAGAIADDLWSDGNEEAMAEETLRVSQAPGPPPAEDTTEAAPPPASLATESANPTDAKEFGDADSATTANTEASPSTSLAEASSEAHRSMSVEPRDQFGSGPLADGVSPDTELLVGATGAEPAPSAHPISEPTPVERT
ncbi:MAG: hypothetical protein RJA70_3954 [Pseudomonadota bacterium]